MNSLNILFMKLENILKAKIYQFKDYTIEVVHDPANHLSQDLQDELAEECAELSRESFGNPHINEEFR